MSWSVISCSSEACCWHINEKHHSFFVEIYCIKKQFALLRGQSQVTSTKLDFGNKSDSFLTSYNFYNTQKGSLPISLKFTFIKIARHIPS